MKQKPLMLFPSLDSWRCVELQPKSFPLAQLIPRCTGAQIIVITCICLVFVSLFVISYTSAALKASYHRKRNGAATPPPSRWVKREPLTRAPGSPSILTPTSSSKPRACTPPDKFRLSLHTTLFPSPPPLLSISSQPASPPSLTHCCLTLYPVSGRYRCLSAPLAVRTTMRMTPPELPSHRMASLRASLTKPTASSSLMPSFQFASQ